MSFLSLHNHTMFSLMDGYSTPRQMAKQAKENGVTALAISDHGIISGAVQHYDACKEVGITPIIGIEAYFKPTFDIEKIRENKDRRSYHLCLFAKNVKGYENINTIITHATKYNKYYRGYVTFDLLEKYHEGVICTSACVGGYPSQAIVKGKKELSERSLRRFKGIFGKDFYVEIQPYAVDHEGTQEKVNVDLIEMAYSLDIPMILTSDSHFASMDEWESYLAMHKVYGTEKKFKDKKFDPDMTYGERYLPRKTEMQRRFWAMHQQDFDFDTAKVYLNKMNRDMRALEESVDPDLFDNLSLEMPKIPGVDDEAKLLKQKVKKGLIKRGKDKNRTYVERCKRELDVIITQQFAGYFLMVEDFISFAKSQNIIVGKGRGSVCNCLVAYMLEITDVDSIYFNLDFDRFMRKGKVKIPDIDIDIESARRKEVTDYILNKYPDSSAPVGSYGLYKTDVLINSLWDVFGDGDRDSSAKATFKTFVKKRLGSEEELIPYEMAEKQHWSELSYYNDQHNDIVKHLYQMMNKIKYFGTHAAGIAISGGKLMERSALREGKDGELTSVFDLVDIERLGVIKFDLLGLKTLSKIGDMRKLTGIKDFNFDWLFDQKLIDEFAAGHTDGIFQYDRPACQEMMRGIGITKFDDVIAVNAMNRPASLTMKMPERYGQQKKASDDSAKNTPYWEYVQETYGCIIYQEQVLAIARNIGDFTADEADILVKMEHNAGSRTKRELDEKHYHTLKDKFVTNAVDNHDLDEQEATELFESCSLYGFNKGHSVGYALIALEECYYKVYHPAVYWTVKCKYAKDENEQFRFCTKATLDNIDTFPAHVNYSKAATRLRAIKDDDSVVKVIQLGISDIKGIGEVAGKAIEQERKKGIFKSKDDFIERCSGRKVNKGIITKLEKAGALEFDINKYYIHVSKYNAILIEKGRKI